MIRPTLIRLSLAVALFSLALSTSAQAQVSVLSEYYGRGVHAYYGGDLIKAFDLLTKAIDGGLNDPRAYYYRGLTSIASGRELEADADFQQGAQLEAKGGFGPSVGMALARIQGTTRLKLEDARREARLAYETAARARSRARYGEIDAAAGEVLREPPRPAAPAPPAPPTLPPVADAPFAADAPAGEPTVEANDALEGTMTDPFADDAAAPAAAAPAAGGNDPFNAPAEEAADPFAAPAGDAPAEDAAADPFADPF